MIVKDEKKPSLVKGKQPKNVNLPKQMGKNQVDTKKDVSNVNNQISKLNKVLQGVNQKKVDTSKAPETELSISIQHSDRNENRFRRVRHGEDDPVTPARKNQPRASVKLG